MRYGIVVLSWAVGVMGLSPAMAFAAAPRTQPARMVELTTKPATTQPTLQPDIQALLDQLSAASPTARDQAQRKLEAMGKSILPTLKGLTNADDPEMRGRVRALVRRLERRLPPVAPKHGFVRRRSIKTSINGGNKTVEVNDNGQVIHIEQTGDAIKMTVSGVDASGHDATETYEAKTSDELKRDNPEAYALYDRWTNGSGNAGLLIRSSIRLQMMPNVAPNPAVVIPNMLPQDPLGGVREWIRAQIQQGDLPADLQIPLLTQLDNIQQQHQGAKPPPGDLEPR